jgi:prepilin-type N-terminal cleavage/methylation domain-containing protein
MRSLHSQRGFTLVEIIVSLAIFSVVAVIAVGALVRVTSANRQAQAIQSGVNNISFVLDAISREMRVGTTYLCYGNGVSFNDGTNRVSYGLPTTNCSFANTDTLVVFNSSNLDRSNGNNLKYGYLFHPINSAGAVTVAIYKGEEVNSGDMPANVPFYPVTSQGVNITDAKVGVYGGPSTSDPFQWVFIRLKGYVGTKVKDQSVFDIQTSISQRIAGS